MNSIQNAKLLELRLCFANGDSILTRFNGSLKEAQEYYIGKIFNVGSVRDDLQACTAIELLA